MKSVNRKVLMTLMGVVLAAPFLVIASVVAIQVAALAENVRVDVFCVALALLSVAVKIVDGHLAPRTEQTQRDQFGHNGSTAMSESSMIRPGY
jgi:hypothetical protein